MKTDQKNWHTLTLSETEQHFDSISSDGLDIAAVKERLRRYGLNEIKDNNPVRWYHIFLNQFRDWLILILCMAAGISVFLEEYIDAAVIMAIVALNSLFSFVQEWKAENALQKLKAMLSPTCRVIREGRLQAIERGQLVPGDRVVIESGDQVPADLRLVNTLNLKVDEAALTGESLAVEKNTAALPEDTALTARGNMVWMGTTIMNGRAEGLVVATGMSTQFGQIAGLTETIRRPVINLKRKLEDLAKKLGVLAILIALCMVVIGVLGGRNWLEMFMQGVSLAVAAVPEGLPAVVTITLAIGVRILVKQKALLRQLRAAETLGATSVICTDKTGTLTKNEMTVQKIWLADMEVDVTGQGYEPEGTFEQQGQDIDPQSHVSLMALMETGIKCNHARVVTNNGNWQAIGMPTEAALIVLAEKAGIRRLHDFNIVSEFSFNSTRKRMSVVEETAEGLTLHMKGAPEVLLVRASHIMKDGACVPIDEADRKAVEKACKAYADQGLRTLALARKDLGKGAAINEKVAEKEICFIGVIGVMDPPRVEVAGAIEMARGAGIDVLMITGDSPDTARAIAQKIGLPAEKTLTGQALESLSDEDLLTAIEAQAIFARTVPEHKHRIVKLLQERKHIVAMTGDGVNDAPALKQADIGIAMGIRGTDVAKNAADMILMDDNFVSIVSAVEEGRRQYANIQKFVRYLLSSNVGEIIAIFLNILMGLPLILLPVQILWMNLVTDSLTAISLGLERAEKDVMSEKPRPIDEPILDQKGIRAILAYGAYIGLATLGLYIFYLGKGPEMLAVANCVAFTGIVVMEKFNVFNFRSLHAPLCKIGFFSNPWLLAAVVFVLSLQVFAVYNPAMQNALNTVPLEPKDWLIIVAVSLPVFFGSEIIKTVKLNRR